MESKIDGRNKIEFKNIIFATLTFSEESLKKLEYDEKEPNNAAKKAISLFRKRWWKKYKNHSNTG